MKKILKIIFFLMISMVSFSFEIDSVDFSKKIPMGKKESKVFTIRNKTKDTYSYKLSIEGDKNVSVYPSALYIAPQSEKTFTVNVVGNEGKGDHDYVLLLDQKLLTEVKKVKTNMLFRIKQRYTII